MAFKFFLVYINVVLKSMMPTRPLLYALSLDVHVWIKFDFWFDAHFLYAGEFFTQKFNILVNYIA